MKRSYECFSPKIEKMIHIAAGDEPCWKFPLHSHNDQLELSLVLAGSGTLYCSGQILMIRQGDLIVKNAGVLHAEYSDCADPLEQVCFSLSGVQAEGRPLNHLLSRGASPVIRTGRTFPLLKEQVLFLLEHYRETEDLRKETARNMLCALLSLVSLLIAEQEEACGSRLYPENIEKVVSYINENYRKRLSLEDIAKKFFSTPGSLSKKFREATGYSVNQYIINCRMGEAQRLLLFEENPVKDTAIRCGYSDLQYFYRTFKKHTGLTPIEFQQKYRHSTPGR